METRRKPEDSNTMTERYFERILVETRYIDAVVPDTSVELFGRKFSTPVMTAALSHIPGKDGDGMVQMAQGAAKAGALTWVGMTSLEQYGEIAKTGAPLVRIIKPYADEREIISRMEQAEELGAVAIGMDIDHSFNGKGQPDNMLGNAMRPKTLAEIASYCKRTKLPFFIKGVLSAQDAQKCLDAGAGGVLVSHHHGIMASAVPALLVLPDGTRQTQLLDQFEGLYSDSLPQVDVHSELVWMELEDGDLMLEKDDHERYVYIREIEPDAEQPAAAAANIQVGLFKNQKLVAWAEPCETPDSFHGFEEYDFYRLPELQLPVSPQDTLQVAAVVTAYILFRFIYPVVAGWMGRGEEQTIPWTLTEESLTIGPRSIPRQSIRKVHCWPGRNALGQSTGNMVVNIETTGKNRVLRTLSGARAEESAASLEQLVRALGYGDAWDAARS